MNEIRYSRRTVLTLASGAAAIVAAGCGGGKGSRPAAAVEGLATVVRTPQVAADGTAVATAVPSPTPAPTAFAAGAEERALLVGTPWETTLSIRHSGSLGPAVLLLGGVHGNEPGGWLAAEELMAFQPRAGSLLVLPRANQLAMSDFVRTYDELGDLNRLYPGNAQSVLPMERLAAAIVAVSREFGVDVVLDLHESWAFYSTRTQSGTAFLGQTITAGVGPRNPGFVSELVDRVNLRIGLERDYMVARDGSAFRRPETTPTDQATSRGRSSLSLGGHVQGLTPILVEMGQEDQPIERRVALHLLVAEEALTLLGVA
ncbi:MAG: succinylglutamate desuccinylase/aspartoacylase family protein [Dehalococcoidia bacterium]